MNRPRENEENYLPGSSIHVVCYDMFRKVKPGRPIWTNFNGIEIHMEYSETYMARLSKTEEVSSE